jgi:hypothetical protein
MLTFCRCRSRCCCRGTACCHFHNAVSVWNIPNPAFWGKSARVEHGITINSERMSAVLPWVLLNITLVDCSAGSSLSSWSPQRGLCQKSRVVVPRFHVWQRRYRWFHFKGVHSSGKCSDAFSKCWYFLYRYSPTSKMHFWSAISTIACQTLAIRPGSISIPEA